MKPFLIFLIIIGLSPRLNAQNTITPPNMNARVGLYILPYDGGQFAEQYEGWHPLIMSSIAKIAREYFHQQSQVRNQFEAGTSLKDGVLPNVTVVTKITSVSIESGTELIQPREWQGKDKEDNLLYAESVVKRYFKRARITAEVTLYDWQTCKRIRRTASIKGEGLVDKTENITWGDDQIVPRAYASKAAFQKQANGNTQLLGVTPHPRDLDALGKAMNDLSYKMFKILLNHVGAEIRRKQRENRKRPST